LNTLAAKCRKVSKTSSKQKSGVSDQFMGRLHAF